MIVTIRIQPRTKLTGPKFQMMKFIWIYYGCLCIYKCVNAKTSSHSMIQILFDGDTLYFDIFAQNMRMCQEKCFCYNKRKRYAHLLWWIYSVAYIRLKRFANLHLDDSKWKLSTQRIRHEVNSRRNIQSRETEK